MKGSNRVFPKRGLKLRLHFMLFSIVKCYQPIPKGRGERAKDPSPSRVQSPAPHLLHEPLLGMAKMYQAAHLTVQLHPAKLPPRQVAASDPKSQACMNNLAPACARNCPRLCTRPFPAAGPQELRRSKGCSD